LDTFDLLYRALITVFISDLPRDLGNEFLGLTLHETAFSPQLSLLAGKLQEPKVSDFHRLNDSDKIEALRSFSVTPGKAELDPEITEWALAHLSGWILERFKMKIQGQSLWGSRAFDRPMSRDDIRTLFSYCLQIDDLPRLRFLLRASVVRGISLTFPQKMSEASAPIVFQFLWEHRLRIPRMEIRADDGLKYSIASQTVVFVGELLNSETIKAKQLYSLCRAVSLFREETPEIFELLKRVLAADGASKLFRAGLLLVAVVAVRYSEIPADFVDFFFRTLRTNIGSVPGREANVSLFALSQKVKFTPEHADFLRLASGLCEFLSIGFSMLMATL
jgi:hypothetical protein